MPKKYTLIRLLSGPGNDLGQVYWFNGVDMWIPLTYHCIDCQEDLTIGDEGLEANYSYEMISAPSSIFD